MGMADVGAPPKMNREQKRAFMRYLKTPEGRARLAAVKEANAKKAKLAAMMKGNAP